MQNAKPPTLARLAEYRIALLPDSGALPLPGLLSGDTRRLLDNSSRNSETKYTTQPAVKQYAVQVNAPARLVECSRVAAVAVSLFAVPTNVLSLL